MTGVLKKGLGLVFVVFVIWYMFTDPGGLAAALQGDRDLDLGHAGAALPGADPVPHRDLLLLIAGVPWDACSGS